jgi:serine/threonine protein kinase
LAICVRSVTLACRLTPSILFKSALQIITCDYTFPSDTPLSSDAKSFIRHLLVRSPEKRMSPAVCRQHPWLQDAKIPRDVGKLLRAHKKEKKGKKEHKKDKPEKKEKKEKKEGKSDSKKHRRSKKEKS